jgi:hypothetical protein
MGIAFQLPNTDVKKGITYLDALTVARVRARSLVTSGEITLQMRTGFETGNVIMGKYVSGESKFLVSFCWRAEKPELIATKGTLTLQWA